MKSKAEILTEVASSLGITFAITGSVVHVIAAMVYLAKVKRGTFEGIALVLFMAVAWPLFSLGMMQEGYKVFVKKTWPD